MTEQHFTTARPVRLELKVAAGEIEVATTDGEESVVTVDGSDRLVEATRVELIGNRLVIGQRRTPFAGLFGRFDGPLHVRACVPHGSRVEIITAAAEATLDGSFAGLEMKSASGGVRVRGEVDGDAIVKTVSGAVNLSRVTGNLDVRSVSGAVAADCIDGSVSAKSVSGKVRVGALREGEVNVQSVSGAVELGIASGTSIDIDAGSASGELSSEVPLFDVPQNDPSPTVVIRGNTVSGAFRLFRAA